MLACRPPTWVNRHLPRASLRQTLNGHSAPRAGPSCWLRGRASLHLTKPLNTEMTKLTQRRSHASPGRHPGMGWVATRLDEGRHRRNAHANDDVNRSGVLVSTWSRRSWWYAFGSSTEERRATRY